MRASGKWEWGQSQPRDAQDKLFTSSRPSTGEQLSNGACFPPRLHLCHFGPIHPPLGCSILPNRVGVVPHPSPPLSLPPLSPLPPFSSGVSSTTCFQQTAQHPRNQVSFDSSSKHNRVSSLSPLHVQCRANHWIDMSGGKCPIARKCPGTDISSPSSLPASPWIIAFVFPWNVRQSGLDACNHAFTSSDQGTVLTARGWFSPHTTDKNKGSSTSSWTGWVPDCHG